MTLRDWLVENPPPDEAFLQSAAGVASRVLAGEPFLASVRELLDEYALLLHDGQRLRVFAERPEPTGDQRHDAYLAALAEHFATAAGLATPSWATEPDRFLTRFWFVSEVRGFRALAIAESPAAFRRRNVFVSRRSLERC